MKLAMYGHLSHVWTLEVHTKCIPDEASTCSKM